MKQEEEERLVLESNPLEWSVTDVVRFIKLTDCAPLAKIFQEQVRASVLGLLCQLAWSQPHQGEGHHWGQESRKLRLHTCSHQHPVGALTSDGDDISGFPWAFSDTLWWGRGGAAGVVLGGLARLVVSAPGFAFAGGLGTLCPPVEQLSSERLLSSQLHLPGERAEALVGSLHWCPLALLGCPLVE